MVSLTNNSRRAISALLIHSVAGLVGVAFAVALTASVARAESSSAAGSKVVATVGDHPITEQQLDDKLKPEVAALRAQYEQQVERMIEQRSEEMKKQTLQAMADQYLLEQAAKKDQLSVNDYLKKQFTGKDGVTEAQAQKFYDGHKQAGTPPFAQIKDELIADMNRDALLERLRKQTPIKILLAPTRVTVNFAGHPSMGSADAPVTIVEFTDFQCPFCKRSEDTVKQIQQKYGDKVRLVHMDYPLSFHAHALDAAEAARCANAQGKFWPYRDALFANQGKLAPADLKATAKQLGLNTKQFDACFDSGKYKKDIEADMAQGNKLGVDGTPAFFIDGRSLVGAQPLPSFAEIIDDELASKDQKQASAH
ncbi:MAG TPA: thioredoxin domain-containing protein [Candidatus Binataceae bacterium]|nr:thioredoxin domain-containing protein [Candidatus Binataceae bacterium]